MIRDEKSFFGIFTSANIYGEYNSAICEFDFDETIRHFAPEAADEFVQDSRDQPLGRWSEITKGIPTNVTHPAQCDRGKNHVTNHIHLISIPK